MKPIIKVENLSKSYIIGHESRERYTTLRDQMARKARSWFSFGKGEKIKHTTEEFWALKDINFEINQGDRVGIIGRNGAGKSTLLKILSRITEPTTGKITINGRVASLLEVGTGFHPELTGRENIFLNGAILGMSRAEIRKKFDEIVDFAEVEKFLDTPVKRYSSGMYVRLAFAVAAHLEPEILIVDEVLAGGDAQVQKKGLGKMEDVSKNEGRTVLFVSHNMQIINSFCSSSILLEKGKVVIVGLTSEIKDVYLNQFKSSENIVHHPDKEINLEDKAVRILDINVHDINLKTKEFFLFKETIQVSFRFRVYKKTSLCYSIAIINEDDIICFVSLSYTDNKYKENFEKGIYEAFCELPSYMLNQGRYWVMLNVANENHQILAVSDKEISIEIFDDGLERHGYFGPWNTNQI